MNCNLIQIAKTSKYGIRESQNLMKTSASCTVGLQDLRICRRKDFRAFRRRATNWEHCGLRSLGGYKLLGLWTLGVLGGFILDGAQASPMAARSQVVVEVRASAPFGSLGGGVGSRRPIRRSSLSFCLAVGMYSRRKSQCSGFFYYDSHLRSFFAVQ